MLAWAGGEPVEMPERWLLLAADYRVHLRWRAALGHEPLPAAPLVAAAAEELRAPFMDLMTELGRRCSSPEWWASRVSERNTQVSPLFLNCCYLRVALREDAPLGVVCDSAAVLESLAAGRTVRWASRPPRRRWRLEAAGRAARFLFREAIRWAAAPRPPRPRDGEVLIRTWVDESSFTADGQFRDRYFPSLADWLSEQGRPVRTWPSFFNLRRSHRDAWRALSAARADFLPDRRVLRWSDRARTLGAALRSARMPGGEVELAGLDVTRVFAEERRRTAFDDGTLDALIAGHLPRRLAQRGLAPAVFVDTYENMIPEKPLIAGFRRDAPDTRLVGFQHGALYPMFLCNFVTPGEAEFAPLPDRVVCNGERFREILVSEGLPGRLAVVGPSLRYRHLFERSEEHSDGEREPIVFVPLTLDEEMRVELVAKLADALGDFRAARIALKPHPMGPQRDVAPGVEIPSHFEIVGGEMSEWLPRATASVALGSSAVYETLAAGVPIVIVGREAALDLNPLGWEPDLGSVARTTAEIREQLERLLALTPEERRAFRERAGRLLRESFEPVTDERMRTFLPE